MEETRVDQASSWSEASQRPSSFPVSGFCYHWRYPVGKQPHKSRLPLAGSCNFHLSIIRYPTPTPRWKAEEFLLRQWGRALFRCRCAGSASRSCVPDTFGCFQVRSSQGGWKGRDQPSLRRMSEAVRPFSRANGDRNSRCKSRR